MIGQSRILVIVVLVAVLGVRVENDYGWEGTGSGSTVSVAGVGWEWSISPAVNRPVTSVGRGSSPSTKPHGSAVRQSRSSGGASWGSTGASAKQRRLAATRAAAARRNPNPSALICPSGFVKVVREDAMGCVHSTALAAGTIGTAWVPFGGTEQATATPATPVDAGAEGTVPVDEAFVDPATLITIEDVQRLVTNAGVVQLSPERGWVYVNKPVYYSTDAVAHDEQLVVLGQSVTVHLDPVSYRWYPGDGTESFTTSTPGGSWPDGTVTYTYLTPSSDISVRLEVTWQASFTVGGVTYPVAGTAASSTSSDPFTVREAEAVLDR